MIFNSFQLGLALEHCKPQLAALKKALNIYSGEKKARFSKELDRVIDNIDADKLNHHIEKILKEELKNENVYRGLAQYLKRFESEGIQIDINGKLLPSALMEIAAHQDELQRAINKRREG